MRLPICALLVVLASQVPVHADNVIVLNSADASVSLIDEATQKVVDTLAVGKEPHHLMTTPGALENASGKGAGRSLAHTG
jgi:YVTN family beta-propeller protein